MSIEKDVGFNESRVKKLITTAIPTSIVLSNVGSELSYQLPLSASSTFADLFETFDNQKEELGIVNYGVSVTTLEEVFLKVAHGGDHDKKKLSKAKKELSQRRIGISGSDRSLNDEAEVDKPKHVGVAHHDKLSVDSQCGYFMRHMYALFFKRAVYFLRDKKAWFFGFILPSLFVLFGLILMQLAAPSVNQPALEISMNTFNPALSSMANPVPYNAPDEATRCVSSQACYIDNSGIDGIYCCDSEGTTDLMKWFDADEALIYDNGFDMTRYNPDSNDDDSQGGLAYVDQWLLDTMDTTKASRYGTVLWSDGVPDPLEIAADPTSVLIATNWTSAHAAPTFVNTVYDTLIKNVVGNDDVSIKVTMHPMPATQNQSQFNAVINTMLCVFMILLGFPFIPSSFILFVVREKENKAKHIQLVSGVSPHAYWLSTWIWDFASYQFPVSTAVLLLLLRHNSQAWAQPSNPSLHFQLTPHSLRNRCGLATPV
jgi:ATP-binding cassette subfamily A (ABC1) protein 3